MTYIVPNYFIENNYSNLIEIDNLLCLNYITKTKNDFINARTTMHSMVILLDGAKIVHMNSQDMKVLSDEICFLTQNNYYISERIPDNSKYKSLIVYFDDKFIFDLISKYNLIISTKEQQNIIKVNYKKDILLKDTINIFQEYLINKIGTNLLKLKIEEIFLHSLRLNNIAFSKFINSILSTSKHRTKFILESNIDLIQNLDDMCGFTRLSQNQLRRYIKKEYNLTPKVWLDSKRLEKAILMLKNTDKTITDISTTCGYSTVSWFISQFKKQYNQTPKEFRYKI